MAARIAIVAFPALSIDDQQWIDEMRARHDPHARLIDAHATLVFPCTAPADTVAAEMLTLAATTSPIAFGISGTRAVSDAFGSGAHVFLLPDSSASAAITELHDRLYQGVLRPHLRDDIPFVPHITVAGAADHDDCRALAESLHTRSLSVRGTFAEIVLVDVDTMPVTPLVSCRLSRGTASAG
jgi:2'-5' RNA ligase